MAAKQRKRDAAVALRDLAETVGLTPNRKNADMKTDDFESLYAAVVAQRCTPQQKGLEDPVQLENPVQLVDTCWTSASCKNCTAGHLLDTLSSSRTPAGHASPVNIGLLDTLSSSWTIAGRASAANIVMLDTCWTHCPAAAHLLDTQVL